MINRRTFFKSASIFSLCIIASRYVWASGPNFSGLIGKGSLSKSLNNSGSVTKYLSDLLGVPVTSSVDTLGNWTISINGYPPIPLTFSLDEVQITATGKVVSTINNGELYGGPTWGSGDVQTLFATNSSNGSGMALPPSLATSSQSARISHVASGPDGHSLLDIYGLIVTSSGMAVSQASISANILKLEGVASFNTINRLFVGLDILGNITEIATTEQSAAEVWEDVGQIALAFALCFPLSSPAVIGGTILLAAWELWEYKRLH